MTGHHHSFAVQDAREFALDGIRYFEVDGHDIRAEGKVIRVWNNQVLAEVNGQNVEFSLDDVVIDGDTVRIDGRFGLLVHQEHSVQAIPTGIYRFPSVQREYSPRAIRNVAD